MVYNNTCLSLSVYAFTLHYMPADMVLVISYNRICQPEHVRGCERMVKPKCKYNDVTSIVENRKHNYGLEMFRLW